MIGSKGTARMKHVYVEKNLDDYDASKEKVKLQYPGAEPAAEGWAGFEDIMAYKNSIWTQAVGTL